MYYDLLAQIKNAGMARKYSMSIPFTKMDLAVGEVLAGAGYIKSVERYEVGKKSYLKIRLAYKRGKNAMSDFKIVSKPSRRLYVRYSSLRAVKCGHGIAVLSTPLGILEASAAKKSKVGGEYLFEVW